MSVYVDDMRAAFGRMTMCHMIADTTAELLAMCDQIGVDRMWIQQRGEYGEHFDIALTKRRLAVKVGAIEISQRELVMRTWQRSPHAHHREMAARLLPDMEAARAPAQSTLL